MNRLNVYDEHGKKIGEIRDAANEGRDETAEEEESRRKDEAFEARHKRYFPAYWTIGFGIAILMWIILILGHQAPAGIVIATIIGSFILSAVFYRTPLNIIFAAIAWGNIAIIVLGIVLSIVR